jgi:zinc/manganese transport system substrate-binding protein
MIKIIGVAAAAWLWVLPSEAFATVNVFACEPEWAALAEAIGGEEVDVFTATSARQDPHYVRAKPSLIAAIRKSDLVICSGAGLEAGWLPLLLQKAGGGVQQGQVGHLMAAYLAPTLEMPTVLDRSLGDLHPEGNPHVHLNPHLLALVAKELAGRLAVLDPEHAAHYRTRHDDFSRRWGQAIARWEVEARALRGMAVVVHHKSFTYLLDWLGMKETGTLEPKPGIPPTPSHLEALLQNLRLAPARAILHTPYDPKDSVLWLAEKTGAPAVALPFTVGGDAESGDLFALFERSIQLLREANRG